METEVNKDYASKGTALGVGIPALALGGLAFLNQAFGGNWGGFGGFGCNQATALAGGAGLAVMAEKDAKIARLESEKYTDKQVKDLYAYQVSQDEKLLTFLTGIDKRVGQLEVSAPLREQIMEGKIAQVAQQANCCCTALNTQLNALQATLANITKTVVPNTSVCPGWGNVTITPAAATTGA